MINGNISTPLRKKNKTFIVNNTCAFDTILSVIFIGYYDFPKYQKYIENLNNNFLQFCKSIAIHRASTKDFHKRYELLKTSGILVSPNSEMSGDNVMTLNVTYKISSNRNHIR